MAGKQINDKIAVVVIAVVVIGIVLVYTNTQRTHLMQKNEELSDAIDTLNSQVIILGKKLQESMTEVDELKAELADIKSKLTQERLKGSQTGQ